VTINDNLILSDYVSFAETLADIAGKINQKYFRKNHSIKFKENETPVTNADLESELAMRNEIISKFPDHGILGEELPGHNLGSDYMWVLDPIDGTRSFISGKPLFTTLISLIHHNTPLLGIIDQPIIKERWVGSIGNATNLNGIPTKTRACKTLKQAIIYTTGTEHYNPKELKTLEKLQKKTMMTLFSADAYAFGLLSSGHIDIAIEANMEPHDFLALDPVVKGAGGIITDWQGLPLNHNNKSNVLATGDPTIHKDVIEILNN